MDAFGCSRFDGATMAFRPAAINNAFFHGLAVSKTNPSAVGRPVLCEFVRPAGCFLDELWVVWMGPCFYQKPRTQVVYKDWQLAYAAYYRDVLFNSSKGEEPQYKTADHLRRAIQRCLKVVADKGSRPYQVKVASKQVSSEFIEPWDVKIISLLKRQADL
jgi:hypothetical protein